MALRPLFFRLGTGSTVSKWQGTECTDRLSGSCLLTSHLSAAALSGEEVESGLIFSQWILTSVTQLLFFTPPVESLLLLSLWQCWKVKDSVTRDWESDGWKDRWIDRHSGKSSGNLSQIVALLLLTAQFLLARRGQKPSSLTHSLAPGKACDRGEWCDPSCQPCREQRSWWITLPR